MKQIYLGLAFHNHQPVGNFPSVFEEAYQQSYLPMVQVLETNSHVRLSLHYTGPLLDWMKLQHPDFLHRVARLVALGQVEIMTGGYYEPILPAIPDADKQGQIAKLNAASKELFGVLPTGLWLAERVWEPHLPAALAAAGVEWTVLDDTHFKMAGLEDEDLFGYYLTEEQGQSLKVFATSKYLRYSIPWKDVEEVIAFLRDQASDAPRIAVMGDDGEKFGTWPGTYQHCWEKGWMPRFFQALRDNKDWLHLIPLGEYARNFPPLGRVYLPSASYDEMMEWALPAEKSLQLTRIRHELEEQGRQDIAQFLKGGHWRYFLAKYPEANWMYRKMLRVHHKVYQARSRSQEDCGLDELWQAQCNCPYWHGVFGGLYLTDIRAATYQHLVAAERKADEILHDKKPWLAWERTDFDGDGYQEVLAEGNVQTLYFAPHLGGALAEWDLRQPAFNLLSTLARRREAYHEELTKRPSGTDQGEGQAETIHAGIRIKDELPGQLIYDRLPRYSLIDHFFKPGTTFGDFQTGRCDELLDLAGQPYDYTCVSTERGFDFQFRFPGEGYPRASELPLRLEKSVAVARNKAGFETMYTLTNTGKSLLEGLFGSEWNLNLLGGGHNEGAYYSVPGLKLEDSHLDSSGELENVEAITLGNRYLGIELQVQMEPRARLWRFPVQTVSNSEAGIELVYQASCLLSLFHISLPPGEKAHVRLTWLVRTP